MARMALLEKWSSPSVMPLIASVAAFIGQCPALGHSLLRDDVAAVKDNVDLRTLSGLGHVLRRAAELSDSDPGASPVVRPVSATFEWLVWELVRATPISQHAVSIALHALCAAVFVRLLLALGCKERIALAGALLFAVHPVTAAAVSPINARAIVVGTLALLYASLRMTEAKTAPRRGAWAALGVLASALAHEAFVLSAVPLLILAPKDGPRGSRREIALGAGAATLLAVALLWPDLPPPSALLSAGAGLALKYFTVVLVPPTASSFFTPASIAAPLALVVLLVLVALAGLAIRRGRLLAAAGLSLAVLASLALAPAAVRGGVAADRGAYVVLVGLVLAGADLAKSAPQMSSRIFGFAPFALALLLLPLTMLDSDAWHDDEKVMRALASARPNDPEGKLAAAILHADEREYAEAYPVCAEYASARPRSTRAHFCIGTALLAAGDAAGAQVFLKPYVDRHPGDERGRRALADALIETNALKELRAYVVRWRTLYGKVPDVEAMRSDLIKRGAW